MDVMLAGSMTGIEAAKLVAARFEIPVVYLTAQNDAETLIRIKQTHEHGLLTKPFQAEQLHAAIELALARGPEGSVRVVRQSAKLWTRARSNMSRSSRTLPGTIYRSLFELRPEARAGLARMSTLLEDLLRSLKRGFRLKAGYLLCAWRRRWTGPSRTCREPLPRVPPRSPEA